MTTLMEAVADATADVPRVYKVGSVPKDPFERTAADGQIVNRAYTVFSAQLVEDDTHTLDGAGSVRWVQIVAQSFGRTAESTTAQAEAFRSALVGTWLTWDGYEAGPVVGELRPTPPTRDPDDNGVLGTTTTLTATAEEA